MTWSRRPGHGSFDALDGVNCLTDVRQLFESGLDSQLHSRFDGAMAYEYSRDRYRPGSYHVFNRAINGRALFRDDDDREAFSDMLARHLSSAPSSDIRARPYACLRDEVSMFARNLLTTHFHLGLAQKKPGGMENLMQRVLAAYTRRFHRKHGTSGWELISSFQLTATSWNPTRHPHGLQ